MRGEPGPPRRIGPGCFRDTTNTPGTTTPLSGGPPARATPCPKKRLPAHFMVIRGERHDGCQQVPWCEFHGRRSLNMVPDLSHGQCSEQFQAADASQLEFGLTSGPMRRLERLGDPPEMMPDNRQVHRLGELPPVKQQRAHEKAPICAAPARPHPNDPN